METLPDELLVHLAALLLPSARDVIALGSASRRLRAATSHASLWSALCSPSPSVSSGLQRFWPPAAPSREHFCRCALRTRLLSLPGGPLMLRAALVPSPLSNLLLSAVDGRGWVLPRRGRYAAVDARCHAAAASSSAPALGGRPLHLELQLQQLPAGGRGACDVACACEAPPCIAAEALQRPEWFAGSPESAQRCVLYVTAGGAAPTWLGEGGGGAPEWSVAVDVTCVDSVEGAMREIARRAVVGLVASGEQRSWADERPAAPQRPRPVAADVEQRRPVAPTITFSEDLVGDGAINRERWSKRHRKF
eukprot:m51a1_g14636 hypothetical protein (307) ;mRNA; f:40354-41390